MANGQRLWDHDSLFWDWLRILKLKHLEISGLFWEGVRLTKSANKSEHIKNCYNHPVFEHHSVFWESVSLRQQSPVLLVWSDSASEYSWEKHFILWYKLKWVPFWSAPSINMTQFYLTVLFPAFSAFHMYVLLKRGVREQTRATQKQQVWRSFIQRKLELFSTNLSSLIAHKWLVNNV